MTNYSKKQSIEQMNDYDTIKDTGNHCLRQYKPKLSFLRNYVRSIAEISVQQYSTINRHSLACHERRFRPRKEGDEPCDVNRPIKIFPTNPRID